jgi:hypothetical protein
MVIKVHLPGGRATVGSSRSNHALLRDVIAIAIVDCAGTGAQCAEIGTQLLDSAMNPANARIAVRCNAR